MHYFYPVLKSIFLSASYSISVLHATTKSYHFYKIENKMNKGKIIFV